MAGTFLLLLGGRLGGISYVADVGGGPSPAALSVAEGLGGGVADVGGDPTPAALSAAEGLFTVSAAHALHFPGWDFTNETVLGFDDEDTEGIYMMALGDVDGDDRLDVVAGSWSDGGLAVVLSRGEDAATGAPLWSEAIAVNVSAESNFFYSITDMRVGDVDGDGRHDIVACGNENKVWVLANEGVVDENGTFVPRWRLEQEWTQTAGWHSVRLVDVDGDGDLDILLSTRDYCDTLGEDPAVEGPSPPADCDSACGCAVWMRNEASSTSAHWFPPAKMRIMAYARAAQGCRTVSHFREALSVSLSSLAGAHTQRFQKLIRVGIPSVIISPQGPEGWMLRLKLSLKIELK